QEKYDMAAGEFRDAKTRLKGELEGLAQKLDAFLAVGYGRSPKDDAAYKEWLNSHQPFHWFAEFYGILHRGGFDVIIGNPPYVGYKEVCSCYTVQNVTTAECSNLFAFVLERCTKLTR